MANQSVCVQFLPRREGEKQDGSNATIAVDKLDLREHVRKQLRHKLPNKEASIDLPHLSSGEVSLELMATDGKVPITRIPSGVLPFRVRV